MNVMERDESEYAASELRGSRFENDGFRNGNAPRVGAGYTGNRRFFPFPYDAV